MDTSTAKAESNIKQRSIESHGKSHKNEVESNVLQNDNHVTTAASSTSYSGINTKSEKVASSVRGDMTVTHASVDAVPVSEEKQTAVNLSASLSSDSLESAEDIDHKPVATQPSEITSADETSNLLNQNDTSHEHESKDKQAER